MSYTGSRYGNPFGFTVTLWVKRLLIINGVLFLLRYAFPPLIVYLGFLPAAILTQPWSVLTYMFVHLDLFHVLFNMLVLFFFGPPLEDRWGPSEFIKFYLICGVGGAVLSLLFWDQRIIGASAAVYGVMLAFAMYWPDNPVYIWGIFPVKAKWLVGFLVGLSLFLAITGGGAGVAHLAEGLRTELHGKEGYQVTVLYPGYIRSEMNEHVEQQTPLMVDTDKGVRAMVGAMEKEVDSACVPRLPWTVLAPVMKHAPIPVLRKLL
jgi:membrane associated rhomboid family serine protease